MAEGAVTAPPRLARLDEVIDTRDQTSEDVSAEECVVARFEADGELVIKVTGEHAGSFGRHRLASVPSPDAIAEPTSLVASGGRRNVSGVPTLLDLSEQARAVIAAEREAVTLRVADLRRQSESIHAVAEQIDRDLASAERLLRRMDEVLGLAPQLAIEDLGGELRGHRLREVAVEVLRQTRGVGVVIHYTEWFELVVREGVQIGGKNPTATFLTQIAKAPQVEPVTTLQPWSPPAYTGAPAIPIKT